MTAPPVPSERQLDRLRELVNIGAGHAAGAFGVFVGRTFTMRVPVIRLLRPETAAAPFVADVHDDPHLDLAGVFFEVEGGLGGLVALLFPIGVRDRVLELLLGPSGRTPSHAQQESALRELGNILASHVVSAIGDTLGTPVLPSVPLLAMHDGATALAALVAHQAGNGPVIRVETEILDEDGELRGILVLVPDLHALAAERAAPPVHC
jgi:chemotaxis protein CheC